MRAETITGILLSTLNRLITSDIKNLSLLTALQKTGLRIEISDLAFEEHIYFTETGLNRHPIKNPSLCREAHYDTLVCIQGDCKAFLTLLITQDPKRSLQQGLSFAGDPKALRDVQNLLFKLKIDWEAILIDCLSKIKWVNMEMYSIFVQSLKQVLSFEYPTLFQTKFETFSMTISDYIKDEKNLTPSNNEIKDFIQEIDQLRSDVERCEARLNALELSHV